MPNPPMQNFIVDLVPALIETLKRQRKKRQFAHNCFWGGIAYGLVAIISVSLVESFTPLAVAFGIFLVNAIAVELLTTNEMDTLKRICEYEDARSLSVLMDTFFEHEFPDKMYVPVVHALNGILPKISVADREAFAPSHIDLLHAIFLQYHDTRLCTSVIAKNHIHQRFKNTLPESLCRSFRVGALHTLVQIGDEETARILKRFIQGRCRSSTQMELQKLALISLLELEKRLTKENEAKTLLRASQYTEDHLLRPSFATATEAPETLLRAVQSDTDSEKL